MKSGIPEISLNVVKLPARLNSFGGGCSNFHQILNKPHLSSSLRVIWSKCLVLPLVQLPVSTRSSKMNVAPLIKQSSEVYSPIVLFVFLSFQCCSFSSFSLFIILSLESFPLSVFYSFCILVFLSFRLSVFLSFCLLVSLSFHLSVFSYFCLFIFFFYSSCLSTSKFILVHYRVAQIVASWLHILSQNVKYSNYVANVTKNLT